MKRDENSTQKIIQKGKQKIYAHEIHNIHRRTTSMLTVVQDETLGNICGCHKSQVVI